MLLTTPGSSHRTEANPVGEIEHGANSYIGSRTFQDNSSCQADDLEGGQADEDGRLVARGNDATTHGVLEIAYGAHLRHEPDWRLEPVRRDAAVHFHLDFGVVATTIEGVLVNALDGVRQEREIVPAR
jgi:hypothetical protein